MSAQDDQRRYRERYPKKKMEYYVRRTYGIELAEYEALIAKGCGICGKTKGKMALDHDHKTGRIRECLCLQCNTGIGNLGDDPAILEAALAYLRKHETV